MAALTHRGRFGRADRPKNWRLSMGRPERESVLEAYRIAAGAHAPLKTKERARIISAKSQYGIRVIWRDGYWVYPGTKRKPKSRIKVWPGEIVVAVRVTIGPTAAWLITDSGLARVPFLFEGLNDIKIILPIINAELVLPRPRPDRGEW
jgi:hypothetical protein